MESDQLGSYLAGSLISYVASGTLCNVLEFFPEKMKKIDVPPKNEYYDK